MRPAITDTFLAWLTVGMAVVPVVWSAVTHHTVLWALLPPAVLLLGVGGYILYHVLGRRIVVDETGVFCRRTFGKEVFIPWKDVTEWGFYERKSRTKYGISITYQFYFPHINTNTIRRLVNMARPVSR